MRPILALAVFAFLAACTFKPSLDDPNLSTRQLNMEEFFAGDLVAYGQFQDILGTVRRRFVVEIDGSWDGETLRLVEDFVYEDGSTEQRIWELTKTGPDTADQTWTGTAAGVIGEASGEERGDVFNWTYTIDLPTRNGSQVVSFDDWMWLLDDDRLLNVAYMKRFGIDIGKVIIVFERRD